MLLLVVLCFVLIILFYISYCKFNRYERCLKTIPAPPTKFFFGNALDIPSSNELLTKLYEYTQICGDICKLYIGPTPTMVLTKDPKLIEQILNSSDLLRKSDAYTYLKGWLGLDGLLLSKGDEHWKIHRRVITSAFHIKILEGFIPIFEKSFDTLAKKFEKEVGKPSTDIQPLISLCFLDIICESAMGCSQNAQINVDSEYVKCLKIMLDVIIKRTFNILYLLSATYKLTNLYVQEKMAIKVLHNYSNTIIKNRKRIFKQKSTIEPDEQEDKPKERPVFIDLLLKCRETEYFSDEDIRQEIETFLFAGSDTTSSALSFALHCLAQNQEVQQKAFEEINDVLGEIEDSTLTTTKLHTLKYLEAVIKETLRLYPSVPMIGRCLNRDVKYKDFIIPKNTDLIIFIHALHRDPSVFEKPDEFLPERFFDGDLQHRQFIPFSFGLRNCIGQKFAMLVMKTALVKILKTYKLFPAENTHIDVIAQVVLISKNGVHVKLTKREL